MHIRMDWRALNFDWNAARSLLVTAEEGSFTAAARALGVAQPTIGRHITALEEELGVLLVERVGRGVELTPTGLDFVEHLRVMGEAANRLSLIAAGQSVEEEGWVSISASETVAAFLLPPIVARSREAYPGISIEIIATNQASDLRRREADIAIRNFLPDEPDLIGKKVRESAAHLYATPDYLERIGNPQTAAELSRAEFVGFNHEEVYMRGLNQMGLSLTPESFPLLSESLFVQMQLVRQGLGIGIMMEEVGEAEPEVVRALPSFPPFPVPLWMVTHREVRTSRRVRAVFDLLAEGLS